MCEDVGCAAGLFCFRVIKNSGKFIRKTEKKEQNVLVWKMTDVRDGNIHVIAIATETELDPSHPMWKRHRFQLLAPGQTVKRGARLMSNGTVLDEEEYHTRRREHQNP